MGNVFKRELPKEAAGNLSSKLCVSLNKGLRVVMCEMSELNLEISKLPHACDSCF